MFRAIRFISWVSAAVLLSGLATPPLHAQQGEGTRLILLGTAGGPSIKKARAQPANALIVNGDVYIIDAGNAVARQMALAGVSARKLRAVFITHNHSDHVADYGTLLLRAWASGLKTPVDTYGPPPLEQMTKSYLDYIDWDVQLRIVDEGRVPLGDLIKPHDIEGDGVIYEDDNVKVTVFEVPHGAAKPSYGFRFDTPHKSIVFSGDTSYSENLIEHAKGVDILVHEVVSIHGVDAIVERIEPGNEALKRHIIEAHTPIEEVGQVAAAAGVKTLVMSHFVPTGVPDFDKPELWMEGVRKHYPGEVIVGEDLLEIP
jgi:ribonuclease BN (tRNA processing enzyme)